MNSLKQTMAAIAVAASFACLAVGQATANEPGSAPKNAGFLADYSKLKAVDGQEGTFRYVDKSADLRPYTKLMIDPVQVFLVPNPDYKGLQVDAMKRMSDAFQQAFVEAVSSGYQIVQQAGPDVLRVRLAITGVQATKPPLGASDFIPIKALFNVGRAAAGAAPKVAEMSAEIELVDPSGRVVGAAMATRKGEKTLAQGEKITWADLQEIVKVWAQNLRLRLDEARAAGPSAK